MVFRSFDFSNWIVDRKAELHVAVCVALFSFTVPVRIHRSYLVSLPLPHTIFSLFCCLYPFQGNGNICARLINDNVGISQTEIARCIETATAKPAVKQLPHADLQNSPHTFPLTP